MEMKSSERSTIVHEKVFKYVFNRAEVAELLEMYGEIQEMEMDGDYIRFVTTEVQSNTVNQEPFWFRNYQHRSSDGRAVLLKDMATPHLQNCVKKYGRQEYKLELEFRNA